LAAQCAGMKTGLDYGIKSRSGTRLHGAFCLKLSSILNEHI